MAGVSCEITKPQFNLTTTESGFRRQEELESDSLSLTSLQLDPEVGSDEEEEESDEVFSRIMREKNGDSSLKSKSKKNHVLLEGYVDTDSEDDLKRGKSLTDEDLDELKGCLDLGFGFSYEEIPELCNTLPALELCYSMSQKFMDEHQQKSPEQSPIAAEPAVSSPIANWKISSPGDHPEDVKARLKYWAQAVACTVKLCS